MKPVLCGALCLLTTHALGVEDVTLYTEHYPPFNIEEEDGMAGINGRLLTMAFDELGIAAQHRVVPWARAQASVREDEDSCFYSAKRTEERDPHHQWVGPLSEEHIVLFSIEERKVALESLDEAAQWRVGGQLGDAYVQWIEDRGIEVETRGGEGSSIDKLIHDRLDLWVAGSIGGAYIASEREVTLYPTYKSPETFSLWLACHRDFPVDVIDQLNETIDKLKQDGTRQRIMDENIES